MLNRLDHKESLPFLKFDDDFLNEILEYFHGRLFYEKDGKKVFFCNAVMMYLEKSITDQV